MITWIHISVWRARRRLLSHLVLNFHAILFDFAAWSLPMPFDSSFESKLSNTPPLFWTSVWNRRFQISDYSKNRFCLPWNASCTVLSSALKESGKIFLFEEKDARTEERYSLLRIWPDLKQAVVLQSLQRDARSQLRKLFLLSLSSPNQIYSFQLSLLFKKFENFYWNLKLNLTLDRKFKI